jgi:ATP synthase F1 complex assembly factor 2
VLCPLLRPLTRRRAAAQSLCATAIDRVPVTRGATIEALLRFFQTDALCVRSNAPALAAAQAAAWDPLLTWTESSLGARPAASDSIFGPEHSAEAVAAMREALVRCDDWQLAGVSALSAAARSLVMAFALARRRVRAADAPTLLRIEEDAQAAEWGFVEGGHDVDIADLRARIAAPVAYLDLLRAV